MTKTVFAISLLIAVAACSGTDDVPEAVSQQQEAFSCTDPAQRFDCAAPAEANKRFVCHGTASASNPYVKISVSPNSPAHVAGVAHGKNAVADQAPGASGNDVGSGPGLDCECNPRICAGACSGAAAGTACDDGDACTGEGSCLGDDCQPGAPNCVAGQAVDACNAQSGACDSGTGECLTEPIEASCDDGDVCTTDDACSNGACEGTPGGCSETTFDWEMSTDGENWFPVALPSTDFGCSFCTRYYRTFVSGIPTSVDFRWGSDNEARMFVNDAVVFDEYYVEGVDWCTQASCCSQCCDTFSNCTNIVDAQAPLSLDAGDLANFVAGTNEIRWQVNQQSGGSGFHSLMTVTF